MAVHYAETSELAAHVPEVIDPRYTTPLQWGIREAALVGGEFVLEDIDPAKVVDEIEEWVRSCAEWHIADDGEWFGRLQALLDLMRTMSEPEARVLIAAALIGDKTSQIPPIDQATGGLVTAWFGPSGAWVRVDHAVHQQLLAEGALRARPVEATPQTPAIAAAPAPAVDPHYPIPGVTHSRGYLAAMRVDAPPASVAPAISSAQTRGNDRAEHLRALAHLADEI